MNISLSAMDDPYSSEVFELTKSGLLPYVDEVFGWDDQFQKQRMRDEYLPEWFKWVVVGKQKIGYVCFKTYEQSLHLHLIILDKAFQGKGLGKKIMIAIQTIAGEQERDVTLSCFKKNVKAVQLYRSLHYEVTEEEEHFILFRLPHVKKNLSSPDI